MRDARAKGRENMAILVTGAAGFIGAHVCRALLALGERVVGIDSLNAYYPVALKQARLAGLVGNSPDFRFFHGDFAEAGQLQAAIAGESIDRIVHLGAQAGVRHSIEAPREYGHSNLIGHLELLELARELGVRHFVYASSSSVYGDTSALPFSAESRADHPVSLYAATKKANELMTESYAHLFRFPATSLRFFTVYGPWGRPDMALWRFAEQLFAGQPLPIFNGGHMRRDFTYIDDIVAGVLAALARPPADDGAVKPGGSRSPHAVYNLGNDQPAALGDLVGILSEAAGITPILDYQPMQPGDVTVTWADIGPARRDLGYAPATPLAVGVPRFVSWYRGYTGV